MNQCGLPGCCCSMMQIDIQPFQRQIIENGPLVNLKAFGQVNLTVAGHHMHVWSTCRVTITQMCNPVNVDNHALVWAQHHQSASIVQSVKARLASGLANLLQMRSHRQLLTAVIFHTAYKPSAPTGAYTATLNERYKKLLCINSRHHSSSSEQQKF